MERSTAALIGFGFVAAVVGLTVFSHGSHKAARPAASAVPSASHSSAPSASAPTLDTDGGDAPSPDDAGVVPVTEGFETFPDGGKVPPLADSRPNQVTFGVVQFSYKGAQFAPADARSKAQALERANATLELAKHDFAAAVGKGDHGSTADAGKIPRGVLEPPIEYLLFMLDKGTVLAEPVDTPRGYWILRRND
ncbi:MAG TPA: hypothetical protein VGM29_00500 [Polyangiaceae bacterium]|jgi:hypothetical protein